MKMWPTPKASEMDRGVCMAEANRKSPALRTAIHIDGPQGGVMTNMSTKGQDLNPDWVEQMMGYRPMWTALED